MDILVFPTDPPRQDLLDDWIVDLAEPSYSKTQPPYLAQGWRKVRHKVGTGSGSGRRTAGVLGVSQLGF